MYFSCRFFAKSNHPGYPFLNLKPCFRQMKPVWSNNSHWLASKNSPHPHHWGGSAKETINSASHAKWVASSGRELCISAGWRQDLFSRSPCLHKRRRQGLRCARNSHFGSGLSHRNRSFAGGGPLLVSWLSRRCSLENQWESFLGERACQWNIPNYLLTHQGKLDISENQPCW